MKEGSVRMDLWRLKGGEGKPRWRATALRGMGRDAAPVGINAYGPTAYVAAVDCYIAAKADWDWIEDSSHNARKVKALAERTVREWELSDRGLRPMGIVRCFCNLRLKGLKGGK